MNLIKGVPHNQQTEQSKTVSSLSRLWKDGNVPFTYRGVLAARWMDGRRAIIERAMRDIQENSCVVFEDIKQTEYFYGF